MSTLTQPAPAPGAVQETTPPVQAFAAAELVAVRSGEPAWVLPVRQAGVARFTELGYPGLDHEDWRFTNLAPLVALPFKPVGAVGYGSVRARDLAGLPFTDLAGDRLVFVDGHFAPALSRIGEHAPGVVVGNLAAALKSHPDLIQQHLGVPARDPFSAFFALNDAYFTDGAFILVPAGKEVVEPIQVIFVATGRETGATVHARNLILAGPDTRVTVIEQFVGLNPAATVTNVVTHLNAGANAAVEHLRFQDESKTAFHVGALEAIIGRAANVIAHSFALGARLSRQTINTLLDGEGLEAVLNGLYLTDGDQLADHHMVVDHAKPHCASHEYFNGILAGKSRTVFHGRILVRKGAQKTDAKQTNKNILLSDDATADTKPQLEIYADDVKCTHGATVGQLNPESLFYMRARGISLETARRMLIHSFAGEIIERVRHTPLREALDQLIWDRLEADERVHVGAHH